MSVECAQEDENVVLIAIQATTALNNRYLRTEVKINK